MDIVFLAYHSWLFFKTIVQFSSPFPIIRFCFIRYCVQVWLNEKNVVENFKIFHRSRK